MIALIDNIKTLLNKGDTLPFSIYSSIHEQKILNVPIAKPLLIFVLSGVKKLGPNDDIICQTNDFIFLSDSSSINMRNIPNDDEYFALLIEFDYNDFKDIPLSNSNKKDYFIGQNTDPLNQCLQQFIECYKWATPSILTSRKKEILTLLYALGYTDITSMMDNNKISHKVHDIIHSKNFIDINTQTICKQLLMSESTLRRKLKSEGTNVQKIKDSAKLGLGLHLLQTTVIPIGLIADQCGYQSQSRFTDRFKQLFGLTPSELRKTKMTL
ncbi:MAG: helix-turn-helix transcriptional regulator [Saccharospirillaceae bacterium]|nr:helix-turn-helix transcriptional regulator [Pseudomonadales bacterium]NRB77566.1 helix-turn-helix transcriptional regulator [Saccharospirillaceae bacterium]